MAEKAGDNMKEYKYIGTANIWYSYNPPNLPEEYVKCCKAGHKLRSIQLGNCYHKYQCDICEIEWNVDSSD